MEDKGKILLAASNLTTHQELIDTRLPEEWELVIGDNIETVEEILKTNEITIGILDIALAKKIDEAIFLNNSINTFWIGLLQDPEIHQYETQKLIHDYFYTYFIMPLDSRQLLCTIEYLGTMRKFHKDQDTPLYINGVTIKNSSLCMKELTKNILKLSAVDAPVFISGETGTGKELAAHAIHQYSRRAHGPFIAVNCGAIPPDLIQAAFFGYEKGAFTGATQRRKGYIEAANGGVLFLDEIGDLSTDMQVCLLRFLEKHQISRLGSSEEINIDVRIIAATHIDLYKAVENGAFREDLYYRINVLNLHTPPLRERIEEIETLSEDILQRYSNEKPAALIGFSENSINCMKIYTWPGNYRELINRIRRAMIMGQTPWITHEDMMLDTTVNTSTTYNIHTIRNNAKKQAIESSLGRNRNNISKAAKELGVSRVTLYRLIEKHDISIRDVDLDRTSSKNAKVNYNLGYI